MGSTPVASVAWRSHDHLDAPDPSIARGIVDAPGPHRLSLPQLDEVLDAVAGCSACAPAR
jgi:hypothetical protein